jgi:hypothetical protein
MTVVALEMSIGTDVMRSINWDSDPTSKTPFGSAIALSDVTSSIPATYNDPLTKLKLDALASESWPSIHNVPSKTIVPEMLALV